MNVHMNKFSATPVKSMCRLTRRSISLYLLVGGLVLTSGVYYTRSRRPSDSSPWSPQYSRLWGSTGQAWVPSSPLPDFSFAGYGLGEREIPYIPVSANVREFGAVGDGQTDDTRAFLEAIRSTSGGAIRIPRGRYLLMDVLRIATSGVMLQGDGEASTTLFFPRSLQDVLGPAPDIYGDNGHWSWGGGFLWLHGTDNGKQIAVVTQPARRGDTMLHVDSTHEIRPGSLIRIVLQESDGSLWNELHGGPADPAPELFELTGGRLVDWVTPVREVGQNSVRIDRPLRVDVRSEWRPAVFSFLPTVQQVGVQDLTIEFPPSTAAPHLQEAGYNGIFLDGISQFWIRNVSILNCDSGVTSVGISRFGTIDGLRLSNEHRAGHVTGHHGISLEGPQDLLITNFRIETRFRHDLTVSSLSNGNVFSRGRGISINFDHHTGGPYENLFTDIEAGLADRLWESGGPSTGWGPHSGVRETFWNLWTRQLVHSLPEYPQVLFVGVHTNVVDHTRDRIVEPIDPHCLFPQDLYRAQVRRRLTAR